MTEAISRRIKYSAFGLEITSDLALPELSTTPNADACADQVSIAASSRQDWPALKASKHSTPTVQMSCGDWRLELEGIGWFRVHAGLSISWQRWDDSVSDRDLRTFLVGSALGALMIQRGCLVLQGTAMVKEGQAVLLLGSPASGKSTLAWCLHQQGWQLLSSELTVIDQQGMVWPGMQQLKLWHDAAVELGLEWQQMPLVRRGLKRYSLLPPDLAVALQPTPLAVIYGLNRRSKEMEKAEKQADKQAEKESEKQAGKQTDKGSDNQTEKEADKKADKEADEQAEKQANEYAAEICAWKVLKQQVALLTLRNQAFQPRFYRGMEQEPQLFLNAAELARRVGLHRLQLPDDVKRLQKALLEVNILDPISLAAKQGQGDSTQETESKQPELSGEQP
ncbi:MAG: hypothetical protein AB8B36_12075 [Prochlorococcus sp.]